MCLNYCIFRDISLTLILIQNVFGHTKLDLRQKQSLLTKITLYD